MGMTLRVEDFAAIARRPRPVVVGVLAQYTVMVRITPYPFSCCLFSLVVCCCYRSSTPPVAEPTSARRFGMTCQRVYTDEAEATL